MLIVVPLECNGFNILTDAFMVIDHAWVEISIFNNFQNSKHL